MRLTTLLPSSLACLCLAGLLLCEGSCRKKTQAPSVVVYCSVDKDQAEPILKLFEEQTGIRVLALYDSSEASKTVGLVNRLRAEKDSPAADVFWSNECFHMARLCDEGMLSSYRSQSTRDWPARWADRQGRWYGFAARARVIAYSTSRVPAEDAPRTLEDLLNVRWKGRLAMADPQFGTTSGDVASWFVHYGPDRAKVILRGLKINAIRLEEGNSMAVRAVVNGLADVALTDTDDVYSAQRDGKQVGMNYLLIGDWATGNGGVLAVPNTAAIVKGAPHPEQAQALMEFLLSKRTEELMLRSDCHNTPLRATIPKEFQRYAIPHPLNVDCARVARALPEAVEAAMEILR